MTIYKFSTDDVRRGERFDYLDDFLRSRFFDMDIGLAADRRPDVHASAKLLVNRHAVMIELKTTPLGFDRAPRNIERAPSGTFILCRTGQGSSSFKPDGQEAFIAPPGKLAAGSADFAFKSDVVADADQTFRLLALPESRLDQALGVRRPVPLQPIDGEHGIYSLLSIYYDALWREIEHLSAAQEAIAIDTIVQLLAVARGALAPQHEMARDGMREARRQQAREHIEANLHDPALAPAVTAAALDISVRQLHALFEPMSSTYARHVLARRLERARLMLLAQPRQPVIDIAYACGFESLTTFNRGFRLAFGMSPTELRETALPER